MTHWFGVVECIGNMRLNLLSFADCEAIDKLSTTWKDVVICGNVSIWIWMLVINAMSIFQTVLQITKFGVWRRSESSTRTTLSLLKIWVDAYTCTIYLYLQNGINLYDISVLLLSLRQIHSWAWSMYNNPCTFMTMFHVVITGVRVVGLNTYWEAPWVFIFALHRKCAHSLVAALFTHVLLKYHMYVFLGYKSSLDIVSRQ